MKKLHSSVALFFVVYALIAFGAVLLYAHIAPIPLAVLDCFARSYRFNNGLLLFCTLLPVLALSGLVVAYSWCFSQKNEEKRVTMKLYLKNVMLTILICLVVAFCARELVRPLILSKSAAIINSSTDYTEFSKSAERCYKERHFAQAHAFASQALLIDNSSVDLQNLAKQSELRSSMQQDVPTEKLLALLATEENQIYLNIPVTELVERAKQSYRAGNFFEAHYYAVLAIDASRVDAASVIDKNGNAQNEPLVDISLARNLNEEENIFATKTIDGTLASTGAKSGTFANNSLQQNAQDAKINPIKSEFLPLVQEATEVANLAWEKLQIADSSLGAQAELLYRTKKAGYSAILTGNFERAYYIFWTLQNESGRDPDVNRYLDMAKKALQNQVFFTDEAQDLQAFESARNVYFSVPTKNDGLLLVGIRGFSAIARGKTTERYLRGVHLMEYDKNRYLIADMYVQNAKVLAEGDAKNAVPVLLVRSIDRNTDGNAQTPVFYGGTNLASSTVLNDEKTSVTLPLLYKDFMQIIDASQGHARMSIADLMRFYVKAGQFGFDKEVFLHALCTRLCWPFLFVLLAIFAVSVAWHFRLAHKQLVHFWWLFMVPLFALIVYVLLTLCEFFQDLFIINVLGKTGIFVLPIVLLSYLMVFCILCFFFLRQKID